MAVCIPIRRLKKVDLPTLGRPTIATIGFDIFAFYFKQNTKYKGEKKFRGNSEEENRCYRCCFRDKRIKTVLPEFDQKQCPAINLL